MAKSQRKNGKTYDVNAEPDTPLLWTIREHVGLTGTKYGCGVAQCGACSVHINGKLVRSCRSSRCRAIKPDLDKIRRPSKVFQPSAATRCRLPGPRWTSRNAATVKAARSWRPPRCSKATRIRATRTSTTR